MSQIPQIKILVRLFFLVFTSLFVLGLQEREVKCGHRLYLSTASWYTAYDICDRNKKVLALPESDLPLLITLLDDLLNDVKEFVPIGSSNPGFWIGAFRRTSTNESMNFRCKSLNVDHHENQSPSTEDILCLYYNFSDRKVLAESCNSYKPFICMNPKFEASECAMNSSVIHLKNSDQYVLNQVIKPTSPDEQSCTKQFLETSTSYAMYFSSSTCFMYNYKDADTIEPLRENVTDLKHKSILMFLNSLPVSSNLKPLSEWCPVMTPKLIQEKIENTKKNLTVNRRNTTKYQRTLISAPDDRPSSKYMGVTGALVLSLVAGLIVCIDLVNFCKKVKPVRVKIE